MHFAYEGFTQNGSRRCFRFRGVEEVAPVDQFAIEIELSLFAQHRISLQDGPSFCLQMLTGACSADPLELARLHSYLVVGDDFRPLLLERKKREDEKALRAKNRSPYRKPSFSSNLRMGKPVSPPVR